MLQCSTSMELTWGVGSCYINFFFFNDICNSIIFFIHPKYIAVKNPLIVLKVWQFMWFFYPFHFFLIARTRRRNSRTQTPVYAIRFGIVRICSWICQAVQRERITFKCLDLQWWINCSRKRYVLLLRISFDKFYDSFFSFFFLYQSPYKAINEVDVFIHFPRK